MLEFSIFQLTGILLSLYLDWNFVELILIFGLGTGKRLFLRPWFHRIEEYGVRLASRRTLCITLAFLMPVLIRAALLPWDPVPQPWIPDEFSHLLIADTLLHGRFANPPHPLWAHFETIHEIFQPTYASAYFPGLGLALAVGKLLGHYWIGVLLSSGAMCAALLWMMYGFFPPRWALLGGVLAVLRWGVLSYWVNSYWGGTMGALAGALVLGAYIRLRRRAAISQGLVLGAGLVLLAYSRPLEGFILAVPVAVALLWPYRKLVRMGDLVRTAAPIVLVLAVGMAGLGWYFKAITGNPLRMPYRVNQELYGWPLTLPWDHTKPVAYRNSEMQFYFLWERCVQYRKTWPNQALKFAAFHLAPLWRFFLGPALTIPFVLAGRWWRDSRTRLLLVCLAASAFVGFITVAYPHYISPATACFLGVTVQAFRHLRIRERKTTRSGLAWSRIAVTVCVLMFLVRAFIDARYLPATTPGQHTWSALGADQGEWRANIVRRLDAMPGAHLVFVQYDHRGFGTTEWVYNEADIDRSKIVWARDLGSEKNEEVLRYYPDRKPWLVTPDDAPDALLPYDPALARLNVIQPVTPVICPEVDPSDPKPKIFKPPK